MELRFELYDAFDMTSFAQVLYGASNLRNLSLEFQGSPGLVDPMPPLEIPKQHSFHIESLKVIVGYSVADNMVESLYDILAYLTASLIDFSLLRYIDPGYMTFSLKFPYGSMIQLQIGPCYLTDILDDLLGGRNILRSLQFKTSSFLPDEFYTWPTWSDFPSLRHLRFHDYVMPEKEHVEGMARSLLTGDNFESLEIISCHKLSEDFLLGLQEELGERLTWSL
jgi:hypothetical protein